MPAPIATPIRGELASVTFDARIFHGLYGRGETEGHERIELTHVLRRHVVLGREAGDLAADFYGEGAHVHASMRRTPLRPFTMPSQALATVLPMGDTMPKPVTTTLRLDKPSLLEGWTNQTKNTGTAFRGGTARDAPQV
jgi:hypothetical protein